MIIFAEKKVEWSKNFKKTSGEKKFKEQQVQEVLHSCQGLGFVLQHCF